MAPGTELEQLEGFAGGVFLFLFFGGFIGRPLRGHLVFCFLALGQKDATLGDHRWLGLFFFLPIGFFRCPVFLAHNQKGVVLFFWGLYWFRPLRFFWGRVVICFTRLGLVCYGFLGFLAFRDFDFASQFGEIMEQKKSWYKRVVWF